MHGGRDRRPLLSEQSQLLGRHRSNVAELRHALKGRSTHHLHASTNQATKIPDALLSNLVCPKLFVGNFLGSPTKSMTGRHCWFGAYQQPLFYFALSNDKATKVEPSLSRAKSELWSMDWDRIGDETISWLTSA
tara:strand:- start:401 stop:802 length:402 start_codon:yes stop_codon:yes gene_type:complete